MNMRSNSGSTVLVMLHNMVAVIVLTNFFKQELMLTGFIHQIGQLSCCSRSGQIRIR